MRLAPLYQQDREQAVQEGVQQEALKLVLRQLQRRFGEIPQNLEETIRNLPVGEYPCCNRLAVRFLPLQKANHRTDDIKMKETVLLISCNSSNIF